jgi:hypothetical protein
MTSSTTSSTLYHASAKVFTPGQVVVASNPVTHYPNAVAALQANRPAAAPSRSVCVFAATDAPFAVLFLNRQGVPLSQINLYEVVISNAARGPFAAIHQIEKRLANSQPVSSLVAEYWNPQARWKFYEDFGPQMTVVAQVPNLPSQIALDGAYLSYSVDLDLATSFP